jgi:hypothetical protein
MIKNRRLTMHEGNYICEETRNYTRVRFDVLMVMSMKMAVFWDVAPCSLVDIDRCFRGAYSFHHQDGGSKLL